MNNTSNIDVNKLATLKLIRNMSIKKIDGNDFKKRSGLIRLEEGKHTLEFEYKWEERDGIFIKLYTSFHKRSIEVLAEKNYTFNNASPSRNQAPDFHFRCTDDIKSDSEYSFGVPNSPSLLRDIHTLKDFPENRQYEVLGTIDISNAS